MTDAEFLALRSKGIGGSDVAALVGLHPTKTPFDVWADKMGYLERSEDDARRHWGKVLEVPIAMEYERRTGTWVKVNRETKLDRHHLWTVDGRVFPQYQASGPGVMLRGLEIKTAGVDQAKWWGEAGTDAVPQNYALQVYWYMAHENVDEWDIAVLIGGNDFRIYHLVRDRSIEQVLFNAVDEFWEKHILTGVAPEIGASTSAKEYLAKVFPVNNGLVRQAEPEDMALIEEYKRSSLMFKEAERIKEVLENEIKLRIGDADGIKFDGGRVYWKTIAETHIEAYTKRAYRRFDFRQDTTKKIGEKKTNAASVSSHRSLA